MRSEANDGSAWDRQLESQLRGERDEAVSLFEGDPLDLASSLRARLEEERVSVVPSKDRKPSEGPTKPQRRKTRISTWSAVAVLGITACALVAIGSLAFQLDSGEPSARPWTTHDVVDVSKGDSLEHTSTPLPHHQGEQSQDSTELVSVENERAAEVAVAEVAKVEDSAADVSSGLIDASVTGAMQLSDAKDATQAFFRAMSAHLEPASSNDDETERIDPPPQEVLVAIASNVLGRSRVQ